MRFKVHGRLAAESAVAKSTLVSPKGFDMLQRATEGFHQKVIAPRRVTALVLADALAVHKHFGHLKHAVKIEVDALPRPVLRHVKVLPIPAIADAKDKNRHGEHAC